MSKSKKPVAEKKKSFSIKCELPLPSFVDKDGYASRDDAEFMAKRYCKDRYSIEEK